MADLTIKCDNCGAPLTYDGGEDFHIRCPYCSNTVVVPKEMRPEKKGPQPIRIDASAVARNPEVRKTVSRGLRNIIIILIVTFVVGFIAIIAGSLWLAKVTDEAMTGGDDSMIEEAPTLSPTLIPEPAATPAYAVPQLSFGQKGMNPGQFDDARNIATDGQDTIFVSDYTGGRVQSFDIQGGFFHQWNTGDSDSSIQGMAADRNGKFYVSQGGVIFQFDVAEDDPVAQFDYGDSGDFGDLAVTPQGELVAVWYEGRWGMITGLDGHREAVVFFDDQGNVLNLFESPVSDRTGDPVVDINLVVDGKSNIYILESSDLYIYNSEGEYQNMLTLYNPEEEGATFWTDLSIDGQGQLYLANSWQVNIFENNGRYMDSFPVEISVRSMTVDDKDRMWILSGEQVMQYIKVESGQ